VPVTALLALPIVPCCGAAGLTGVLFTGTFFIGVGFEAGDEAALGGWLIVKVSVAGFFTGVFLTTGDPIGFDTGVGVALTSGLGVAAAGIVFFVATGVRTGVVAGFFNGVAVEAPFMAAGFLMGVAVGVPLAAAGFTGFFVPIGVRTGLLAGTGAVVFTGVETGFLTAGLAAGVDNGLTGFFVPIGVLGLAGVVFLMLSMPASQVSLPIIHIVRSMW
jgi:hypothetical protein